MVDNSPPLYYIRLRGKVQGPFTQARLKSRYEQGTFNRFYEVSTDQIHWQSASTLPGFFAGNPPAETSVENEAPPSQETMPRKDLPPPLKAPTNDPDPGNHASILTSHNLKIVLGVGALCILVMAAALPLFYEELGGLEIPSDVLGSLTAQPIQSVDDEKLEDAIGKVVCGLHFELPGGVTKEIAVGSGTGFLISADGDTLTNQHVVEHLFSDSDLRLWETLLKQELDTDVSINSEVWIFYGDQPYRAEVAYSDRSKDFAILRTSFTDSSFLTLSSKDDIEKGSDLRAYGFPGAADISVSDKESLEKLLRQQAVGTPGLSVTIADQISDDQLEATLTSGIVSRVVNKGGRTLIQHNAAINPGNSGGPVLLTSDAVVCGINTIGIQGSQGIFFSVTLAQLRDKIDEYVPGAVWR